jgi:hypothetical protein
MGNLLSLSDEEVEARIRQMGFAGEAQINACKTLLKDEGLRNIFQNFNAKMDTIKEEVNNIEVMPAPTYEGECGFIVNDPEGQRILNKYLPRGLNDHARDMLNLFSTITFKELRESSDRYPESAFWSSILNWVFLADDPDFKTFFTCTPVDIDNLVNTSHHDKQMTREVLTYLVAKYAEN